MYCSISQAVDIWDELRDAMEGKNGYGGDTAEIYAYRLMPNIPRMGDKKYELADIVRASRSLVGIIEMFREKYQNGTFLIDGIEYHAWDEEYGHTFDHRVHVQFIPINVK